MSRLMPFSARTIRVRWLHGSFGAENSVMMERRLDTRAPPRYRKVPRRRDGSDKSSDRSQADSTTTPRVTRARRPSMHVFPVFLLEQPDEPGEHEQEEHHPDAERAAVHLRRLSGVVQKIDEVAHEAEVFIPRQAPRDDRLEVVEHALRHHAAAVADLDILEHRLLETLDLRQHVRHGDAVEAQIVRAGRPRRIDVEGCEELIEIIRTALAR